MTWTYRRQTDDGMQCCGGESAKRCWRPGCRLARSLARHAIDGGRWPPPAAVVTVSDCAPPPPPPRSDRASSGEKSRLPPPRPRRRCTIFNDAAVRIVTAPLACISAERLRHQKPHCQLSNYASWKKNLKNSMTLQTLSLLGMTPRTVYRCFGAYAFSFLKVFFSFFHFYFFGFVR